MSSFFAEEDNITFGVQGSNEAEVAQFSSTRDDVFYRFFTNNFSETDNFVTGTVIGSSNYDKTNAARNNLYFGHVSEYSNVERIMTITEKRVGINTDPTATFHVVGSNVDHSNVVLVETINSPAYPAFTISKWGKVGFGTTPTNSESDVSVKIKGKLQVDGLQIGGGAAGADGNLISTEGLVSTGGSGSNNYLMFGNNSMCNISSIFLKDSLVAEDNVTASNVLYATNLAPVTGSTIQLSGADLSNVDNVLINQGSYLAVDNIRGSENPDLIQFNAATLSNIDLVVAVTVETSNLTTTAAGGYINVSGKSLSNIEMTYTTNLRTTTIVGDENNNKTISMSESRLTDVQSLTMKSVNGIIHTNLMTSLAGGCNIDFMNTDVTNINNLWVNGDIRARGEFFVLNTTTCNTNQFQIDNDGTGPALIVNQRGPDHIAQFMDDSNIVMFIRDGGQVAIGSFGYNMDNDELNAMRENMLTVNTPEASNQIAVKVIQGDITKDRLTLVGPAGTCNIVFTGDGRMGMGDTTPNARIHIDHAPSESLDFIRLSSNQIAQLTVTTDGHIGLGTAPSGVHRLDVAGTIRAEGFALGGSTLIDARGMYDSTDHILEFNQNVLSNISIMKPVKVQTVGFGTVGSPAYSWEGDSDTGIFRPDENQVAISTGGVERMRVYDSGQVFVGVSTGNARLTVSHLNGKGLQVENELTKNRHVVLHENADNDHEYFGMGVNGTGTADVLRYQVGATTASHVFYAGSSSSASDEIMRVEGAGNVGVGTASTLARLHVKKTTAGDTLRVENTSGQDKKFVIDKNGNVGIGTTVVPFSFVVETTDAMVIPRGTDGERPAAPIMGAIRFNTSTSQFEGYGAGNAWGTLGGVKDVNMDTYISAETSPGTNNDELRFFTSNVEQMRILSANFGGNVGIGTTTAATKLEVAGTIRAPTIEINTLSSTGSVIDVNQKILSNVDILKSDVIETSFLGGYAANSMVVDTMYSTFSNMNTLKTSTVEVSTLTTSAANNTIDVNHKILSNVENVYVNNLVGTDKVYTNVLRSTTQGGTIDLEFSILSNVGFMSNVNVLDVSKVMNTRDAFIDFNSQSLSNLSEIRVTTLEVTTLETSDSLNYINVNNNSLKNIATLSNVDALDVNIIRNTPTSHLNFANNTLSNIAAVKATTLDVTRITTAANGNGDKIIDMVGTSLSNMVMLKTTNIVTNTMAGNLNDQNVIAFAATTLSNIGNVHIQSTETLYVNKINTASGTEINFNGKDLVNISKLRVTGDIQVAGEFFVTNTTTCNTTQMIVDNDGTGPALIVNQSGNQHITQFMDDSNVVMFIKDGGQTAFGSFGGSIDAGDVDFDALVYMNNPGASNQIALHIVHNNADNDTLRIDTFQSNVVFDGLGKLGMGVTTPEARIDVASRDNYTFLNYAISNNDHAFMIGNNGFVGVGTLADTTHAIKAVGIISADQMAMTSVNSSNGWIDFNNISLCNINTLQVTNLSSSSFNATNLVVDTISSVIPQSNIDVTQSSLSNINIARMNTLEVNTITSTGPNIDVYAKTLSNITGVRAMDITTPSITGTGANKEVNFNYSRVLDIDSLVVRSNITVTLAGLNTYTNLPTDLVRIDLGTGKILDQYISSNICRLMSNGLLNPALLPPVETNRNTLMHTRDRVGIGLRNPQQKLHVHGTQVVTSGRLGIGTTTPLATLHLDDDNAGLSTVYINNRGSIDTMNILGSNQTPVFYITANCNVGVRTANPMYNLHVNGTMYASTAVRTNALASDSGTINCGTTSLSNILTAHMTNLVVTGSMTVPATIVASTYTESVHTNSISSYNQTDVEVTDPLHITGYSTNLYTAHDQLYGNNTDITRIGLKVDNSILADTLLTISDYRLKKDIVDSDETDDFQAVLDIPVKRFRYKDHDAQEIIGFIAQEVEEVAPLAVRTIRGPIPTITSSAERISDTTIAIESNYEEITVGTTLRLVIGDADTIRTVVSVSNNEVTLDKPLPTGDVFVYGPVVNDVKLLDTERLIPMTFNAIKKIHREAQEQKALLQDVLARLSALEARIA